MVYYRRNRLPGGTYFFTVTLNDRRSNLLVEHIDSLRHAFRTALRRRPVTIDAVVILPDHLHTIWTLPEGDDDYAGRWRAIKSCFSRSLAKAGVHIARNAKGEYPLWQRRYWEHTVRDGTDLRHHLDYIHFNPVKHRLVRHAAEWPYSTFHRYVRRGLYPSDWAGTTLDWPGAYGE